jgi:hypothetical protein
MGPATSIVRTGRNAKACNVIAGPGHVCNNVSLGGTPCDPARDVKIFWYQKSTGSYDFLDIFTCHAITRVWDSAQSGL